jgi:hypothetical protein
MRVPVIFKTIKEPVKNQWFHAQLFGFFIEDSGDT